MINRLSISSGNTTPNFPASSTSPIYVWCLWCRPFIDNTIYVVALCPNSSTPSFKRNYMPLIFPKLTFNWSANVTTWVLKCMCATYRDMLEYYFSVHSRCHGFAITFQFQYIMNVSSSNYPFLWSSQQGAYFLCSCARLYYCTHQITSHKDSLIQIQW